MDSDTGKDYSGIQAALGSIGLSAALMLGATLLSQGLGFVTRITMARYLPVDGYGNVVIGISVLNLFGIVALVGLPQAVSRYIPRQDTGDEQRHILVSAFQIVGLLSICLAFVIYTAAEPISTIVFQNEDLVWIIRVFAAVLPFYALLRLTIGSYRGYERTSPRVLMDQVLRPVLQLGGIVVFVSLGYDTAGIAFAYAIAFVLVAVVAVGILYRVSESSISDLLHIRSSSRYRELLAFSLPLAASGAVAVIAKHSDLLILGAFKSSSAVGVYEVGFRMSMFVVMSITPAVGFLFQPIISRFHSKNEADMMQLLYTATTRWVVVGTFPIFALFVLFPEQSLTFFFGSEYRDATLTLSILATGFMVSQMLGLTGNFLTAVGKTKSHMYISAGTMVINVAINLALIPIFGIVGAAIATASAQIFNNSSQLYVILRDFDIHPFAREYVLPTAIMAILFIPITLLPLPTQQLTFFEGFGVVSVLAGIFLVLLLITRSVLAVELQLLEALFTRVGVEVPVSEYLGRFTR